MGRPGGAAADGSHRQLTDPAHRSARALEPSSDSPNWPFEPALPRCARSAHMCQEETRTMGAGTPLTYAIGDIHGRLDLLTTLLAQIEQHRAGRIARSCSWATTSIE